MNALDTNPWLKLAGISIDPTWSLICFPFAGGYAEYFMPWYKKLEPCAFYPIQLPGRSYRYKDAAFVNMNALIDSLIPNLIPIIQQRPYVLFGHSMGAYIAYYAAKKIKQLGLNPPVYMVVSAAPAPIYWKARKRLSELSAEEFAVFFKGLGGFNKELLEYESFISLQMELLRQDVILCESCEYIESEQFNHPIYALSASDDPYVSHENMLEWACETNQDFHVEIFEGGHFYLNQNIDKILSILNQTDLLRNKQ